MENKINWRQKLTSRKLWFAIVGVVIGAAMAFGIEGSELQEVIGLIAGAAAAVGSIIGYIDGESAVDAARATGKGEDSGNTVSGDTIMDAVEEGRGKTETF